MLRLIVIVKNIYDFLHLYYKLPTGFHQTLHKTNNTTAKAALDLKSFD